MKSILKLSIPFIVNDLFRFFLYFIDSAMLGHLSKSALASTGIASVTHIMLINFVFGLSAGTQGLSARMMGTSSTEERERFLCQTVKISAVVGLILAAVYLPIISRVLLFAVGNNTEMWVSGMQYLSILNLSLPIMSVFFAFHGFLGGTKNPKAILHAGIAMGLTNTVINWVLIYGFPIWGHQSLGVRGAAIGTVTAQLVGLIILFKATNISLKSILNTKVSKTITHDFIRFSAWPGTQAATGLLGMLGLQSLCAHVGKDPLAVTIVIFTVFRMLQAFNTGISNGGAILIGEAIGLKKNEEILSIFFRTLRVAILITAPVALFIAMSEKYVILSFGKELSDVALLDPALRFFAIFFFVQAIGQVGGIALSKNGFGRVIYGFDVLCQFGLGVGLGSLLLNHTHLQVWGPWVGYAFYQSSLAIISIVLVIRQFKNRPTEVLEYV